jgi:hypothetical protein
MRSLPDPHPVIDMIVSAEFAPLEESVEIVSDRRLGDDAAFAVAFDDRSGVQRRGLIGLCGHEGRWRQRGASLGSVHVTRDTDVWMTSGGWGVPGRSEAAVFGGWVTDPDAEVARAVDMDGRVLEDDVHNGVAIVMYTEEFNLRYARLELLSAGGEVLRSGPLMGRRP